MSYVTKLGAYGLTVVATFAVALAVLLAVSSTPTVEAQTTGLTASAAVPVGVDLAADPPVLGTSTVTLTVSGHTEAWSHNVVSPTAGTCANVAAGTDNDTRDVETGKTYTIAAYAGDDCAAGAAVLGRVQVFIPSVVTTTAVSASPGSSKLITFDTSAWGGDAPRTGTFRISEDGTGSASFAVDDSEAITCKDGGACDIDAIAGWITLRVNVASDSARGAVYVQRYTRSGGDFLVADTDEKTINVAAAASVTRATITASPTSIAAASGSSGSTLTITVVDSKGNGLSGRSINVITTNGTLTCGTTSGVLGCTVRSGSDGTVQVSLNGANRPGTATVTATSGSVTASADVVLYGSPKTISANIAEGSLELGDSTFVVVKVIDSAGNGVSGINPFVAGGGKAPSGPAADSVAVGTSDTVDKAKAGKSAIVDGNRVAANVDTPGCSYGTNAKGECVVQVTATNAPGTSKDASRGTHTVTVQGPEEIKADARQVSVNVDVAGPSDSMSHDAPERIDTLTELKVTVTAVDDNGVRVGSVPFLVEQIEGAGSVISSSSSTRDGQASFTFISSTGDGAVTFFVRVGHVTTGNKVNITDTITVQVGDAMEEPDEPAMPEEPEEPAMPEAASLSGSGALRIFSGGSVADLGAAAEAACPGGADIWLQDGDGTWQRYSTSRPAFTNAPFNAAFAGGFDGATAVFVSSCEADAMENEG